MNQKVDNDTIGKVTFNQYLTYREITYGATVCYIHIGLVDVSAHAVFSQKEGFDKELWVSTDTGCQDFLERRGCPRKLAVCLLQMADDEKGSELNLAQPTEVIVGQKTKE